MKYKYKLSLIIISLFLVVSLCISASYAAWIFSVSQESTNVVVTDCFELTMSNEINAIKLEYAFPMEDELGVQLTPYEFSITNICNHAADYQINLETLNTSTLDESNIKADLNGHVNLYSDLDSVTPTLDNASSAVTLYEDTLVANASKTYNLRLWIKDNAVQNEIENKVYNSKVVVKSTLRKQYAEGTLISGSDFNIALKTLAGAENPDIYTTNTNITSIEKSIVAPEESDNALNIAVPSSKPIYAWFKNGVIYIYSENDTIYMNSDASFMFKFFSGLVNLDLSFLNTSNVTNMEEMFSSSKITTNFNISNFDTSKVTTMANMFNATRGVTSLDLSNFDTSNVTNMRWMFAYMSDLTSLNISNFNTSKVTNMASMFAGLGNITSLNLSSFDTSNVEDMSYMFEHIGNITSLDLSSFDVSKVKTMKYMLSYTTRLVNLNVSSFGTSDVTDLEGMFYYASGIEKLDLGNFKTPKATNMSNMFYSMYALTSLDIHNFDTSSVTDMSSMFHLLPLLTDLDLSSFDTSNVTDMAGMLQLLYKIKTLDLSSFNTSKVTNFYRFLVNNYDLETIYVGDGWDMSNVTSSDDMFGGCTKLVGGAGTRYGYIVNASYAHVDGGTSNPGYLTYKAN